MTNPSTAFDKLAACTSTIASLVAQVVASYGGRKHEVHLPPSRFGPLEVIYLIGQEQAATVLQCLSCKPDGCVCMCVCSCMHAVAGGLLVTGRLLVTGHLAS